MHAHFQPVQDREALFAASFFGDAASASIVGTPEAEHRDYLSLGTGYSVLLPDSMEDMTWKVADYGYDLHLSPRIPKLLGIHLQEELSLLLQSEPFPELWAIHPGGRGIVDSVQEVMNLKPEQTKYSRDVLRDYGNLSSNTILFVLPGDAHGYENAETIGDGRGCNGIWPRFNRRIDEIYVCSGGNIGDGGAEACPSLED